MNPLHPGFDPTAVPSHVECVAPVQDYEEPNGVRLDSELYVQMVDATNKQPRNKQRASKCIHVVSGASCGSEVGGK